MAAPDSVTNKDLNGTWYLNKTLSNDPDAVLALQGISWLTRKAIGLASITLQVKQYVGETDKAVHIDIDQLLGGGIKGTSEARTLDWQWHDHADHIFGKVRGRTRWIKPSEFAAQEDVDEDDKKHLVSGWEKAIADGGDLIEGYVISDAGGWTARQTWGFEEVQVGDHKERRYTRHVVVRKGDVAQRIRLVYDWAGKV